MRVMVIGASRHREKFGNKAVRAYRRQQHEVIPVNPNEHEVEGLPCVDSVLDVEGPVDRALFYVQPDIGMQVIEQIAQRGGIGEVWLNPGAESPALVDRAQQLGIDPILACAIIDIGERP